VNEEWIDDSDLFDLEGVPETNPSTPPLGIGAATVPPTLSDGLYEPTCFVCGQVTPTRDGVTGDALPRIGTMENGDVDRELRELLDEARLDERRIMLFIARRLIAVGQRSYGALDIRTDPRNMQRERNEELGDAIVYVAFEALRNELKG